MQGGTEMRRSILDIEITASVECIDGNIPPVAESTLGRTG